MGGGGGDGVGGGVVGKLDGFVGLAWMGEGCKYWTYEQDGQIEMGIHSFFCFEIPAYGF